MVWPRTSLWDPSRWDAAESTVCVCGGGHLAHVFATSLGACADLQVRVLTRRPAEWSRELEIHYLDKYLLRGRIETATDDPALAVAGADIVFVTTPASIFKEILCRIRPCVESDAWVGAIPGTGGFDWVARETLGPRTRVFGFQRAPYVCRTLRYGHSVALTGIRPKVRMAALPPGEAPGLAARLAKYLNLPIEVTPHFLPVTLSPGNPLFHPARVFALFGDWDGRTIHEVCPLFYEEWDAAATDYYLRLDRELQAVCQALPVDMSAVRPVLAHYDARTPVELTRRIQGLTALRGILAPMHPVDDGFVPDLEHRFVTEDILHCLAVQRAVARLTGVRTPTMDEIIAWAESHVPSASDRPGPALPEFYGITDVAALVRHSGVGDPPPSE